MVNDAGTVYAAVLNHGFPARAFCSAVPASNPATEPPTRLGCSTANPTDDKLFEVVTVIGVPRCQMYVPAACHPPNVARSSRIGLCRRNGISQTPLITTRCGTSRFD